MKLIQWITLTVSLVQLTYCQMESFIVGGSYASIKQYPHSAFLSVACKPKDAYMVTYICGSSILNQRLLLTAAHCFANCMETSRIYAVFGNEHRFKGINITVYSFLIHSSYDEFHSTADIALAKLLVRLHFSEVIKRIALMREPPYDEQAYVAGWGMTEDNKVSPYLKHLDQEVLSVRECINILKNLPEGCICARAKNISHYPDSGDSGNALVVRKYIQIGIVSYKLPSLSLEVIVYADVGYYYDWIQKHSRRIFCAPFFKQHLDGEIDDGEETVLLT